MTASGDDQPIRKRWRLVPILVVTGVLAVIGAVVLCLCGVRVRRFGSGGESRLAVEWSDLQGHRHRARRKARAGWRWTRAPTPSTSPTTTTARCR